MHPPRWRLCVVSAERLSEVASTRQLIRHVSESPHALSNQFLDYLRMQELEKDDTPVQTDTEGLRGGETLVRTIRPANAGNRLRITVSVPASSSASGRPPAAAPPLSSTASSTSSSSAAGATAQATSSSPFGIRSPQMRPRTVGGVSSSASVDGGVSASQSFASLTSPSRVSYTSPLHSSDHAAWGSNSSGNNNNNNNNNSSSNNNATDGASSCRFLLPGDVVSTRGGSASGASPPVVTATATHCDGDGDDAVLLPGPLLPPVSTLLPPMASPTSSDTRPTPLPRVKSASGTRLGPSGGNTSESVNGSGAAAAAAASSGATTAAGQHGVTGGASAPTSPPVGAVQMSDFPPFSPVRGSFATGLLASAMSAAAAATGAARPLEVTVPRVGSGSGSGSGSGRSPLKLSGPALPLEQFVSPTSTAHTGQFKAGNTHVLAASQSRLALPEFSGSSSAVIGKTEALDRPRTPTTVDGRRW